MTPNPASDVLFDVTEVPLSVAEAAPTKWTEADMIRMLAARYSAETAGARRYAVASHVPDRPAFPGRVADFLAVDCWRGGWSTWRPNTASERPWLADADLEWGYPIHGHEIKVSRSDWLTELRAPDKAEAFARHCDYFWLVVNQQQVGRQQLLDRIARLEAIETELGSAREELAKFESVAALVSEVGSDE